MFLLPQLQDPVNAWLGAGAKNCAKRRAAGFVGPALPPISFSVSEGRAVQEMVSIWEAEGTIHSELKVYKARPGYCPLRQVAEVNVRLGPA